LIYTNLNNNISFKYLSINLYYQCNYIIYNYLYIHYKNNLYVFSWELSTINTYSHLYKDANKQLMKMRLIYELMPLIKEYLAEGLLQKAADSFAHLFYTEAGVYLYE